MDWYYVQAGQRVGPVTIARLNELQTSGEINPATLVWNESMTDWQTLGSTTAATTPQLKPSPSSPASTTGAVCAECGHSFNRDEMMAYQSSFVCAACKPVFLQRLREGAAPAASFNLWRKGNQLVVPLGAQLPARCVKCGQAVTTQPIRRKLSWHKQWIFLLLLLNVLIYLIVAIIVRKKAVIEVPICPEHRKRRAMIIAMSWLMVLLSIGMFVLAANVNNGGPWALGGVVLFLIGIILGITKGTLVRAVRIDDRFLWVNGFGKSFLEPLPEWTGPS